MKIVVTGGAGFIGSNVVDAYIDKGHEVVVIDDLSSGKRENVNPKARFHHVDIRSEEILEIMETERPEVVNHHAAQMSVPASVEDPRFDADVNIKGLINVLEASIKTGVKKVVFISSGGAIYGEAEEYPTPETYPAKPLSPYAVTKAASEYYLDFYNHQYGLDYTVLRYANVYGPRQIPHGEAGVIAIFMDRLLAEKPCTVYHFPDEPRGMTRDYCYVGDVARANLLALEGGSREAFNIGTGTPTHTLDLFNAVYESVKSRVPGLPPSFKEPARGPARAGDLKRSCLAAGKAAEELGWRAEVKLGEGIERTTAWRMERGA
ncbi:MAG: NAD-dependent epimerase/dehydratase family protein [Thermodesulfobacteriota bacterium]